MFEKIFCKSLYHYSHIRKVSKYVNITVIIQSTIIIKTKNKNFQNMTNAVNNQS